MFEHIWNWTRKVSNVYITQKILQMKDIYNPAVSKFMFANSQLPATFINYLKFITDVHPYNTRQAKTQ